MSEFGNWIPILGLLIPAISLVVAILTYLRVSRKYLSKTSHFVKEIYPNKEHTAFCINGMGSLQRIEMTARGSQYAQIALLVDGEVCMKDSFDALYRKGSRYITEFRVASPHTEGEFAAEIDLQKNFSKNLELLITNNNSDSLPMKIKGTVHYNICESRLRLHLRKKRRRLTDLSAKTRSA
jgi:hypothetical protein